MKYKFTPLENKLLKAIKEQMERSLESEESIYLKDFIAEEIIYDKEYSASEKNAPLNVKEMTRELNAYGKQIYTSAYKDSIKYFLRDNTAAIKDFCAEWENRQKYEEEVEKDESLERERLEKSFIKSLNHSQRIMYTQLKGSI